MLRYLSRPLSLLRAWGLSLATAASFGAASAGGLQVSPVSLQIANDANADGIWLSNVGDAPMHAQVRVFQWTQKDGADQLTPSTALTVSPPLLEIAPGARQLLRVIRSSSPPAAGTEQTYRLIIDELPVAKPLPELDANAPKKKSAGISFVMRYSLPVFLGDPQDQAIARQLQWTLHKTAQQWRIQVHNGGSMRAQIADLQAVVSGGTSVELRSGLLGYVLPGSTMTWTFPAPAHADAIQSYQAMINEDTQPISVAAAP